jgi:hypothetical protein
VLQYFYGGVEHIMCSIDDPKLVEAEREALGLIPGQERLNNQSWFQISEGADFSRVDQGPEIGGHLNIQVLQALQEHISKSSQSGSLSSLAIVKGALGSVRGSPSISSQAGGMLSRISTQGSISAGSPRLGSGFDKSLGAAAALMQRGSLFKAKRLERRGTSRDMISRRHSGSRTSTIGGPMAAANKGRPAVIRPRFGLLSPEDPFFWFAQQNFSIYTYPAGSVPRHFLNNGSMLEYHYSDFVSRTATPEPRDRKGAGGTGEAGDGEAISGAEFRGPPVPPSICVCQLTELSAHTRVRWEVKKEFVDEQGAILGDTGWFPGALGHRFTFESKTSSVKDYVRLKSVPQAQLLYMEHLDLSGCKAVPQGILEAADCWTSSGSGSDEGEEDEHSGGDAPDRLNRISSLLDSIRADGKEPKGSSPVRRQTPGRRRSRRADQGPKKKADIDHSVSLMLPPLL